MSKQGQTTMKTYLQHVANDLLERFGKDMSRVAIVFPNKRASLFLNQYLVREAARHTGEDTTVIWSPAYITISDLFRRHARYHVADSIMLVCRLYETFCEVTENTRETLDAFYNWGQVMLADFDDIDKNMADATKVFQMLTDYHEMDDISYLSETQKETLKTFFNTFNENSESAVREKFLRLWSRMYDIYSTFRKRLADEGLAYEGMMYRDVAENDDIDFEYDTYCFIGFNMLQKVEQRLFRRLKGMEPRHKGGQPRALFYWDYDTYYLNRSHEAGRFIGEYMARFPDALDGREKENMTATKKGREITYLSATTENMQARYVHDWLLENDRWKDGAKTAVVMADERLLMPIIRSLPEEVEKVNITTGFPLAQSSAVALVMHLMELQTAGKVTGTEKYLMRYVTRVLSHPYTRIVSEEAGEILREMTEKKVFFPDEKFLCRDEGTALLFGNIDETEYNGDRTVSANVKMTLWMQKILHRIAAGERLLTPLDKESLFRTHQVLQRLLTLSVDGTLNVDLTTYRRLIKQVIQSTTVPYHGEPIEGIQIMGVLETRCLDFKHLLVVSCNEGNMPKGVNDSSFIPHSVRRAYELTTVENKVGIYSYYFHRLLQRAEDVTLAYNSSTEGLNSGEMSRFMLQLMAESGLKVRRRFLSTQQQTERAGCQRVVKDESVTERLKEKRKEGKAMSPTEITTYLRCRMRYYYIYIEGLRKEEDSDPEDMDNIMFGLVFHAAAEELYGRLADREGVVHAEAIRNVKEKNATVLERCVDNAFRKEVFHADDKGYVPQYSGLQLINRRVIIRLLNNLMEYDMKHTPIRILGMEEHARVYTTLEADIFGKREEVSIGGMIDRLDIVGNTQGSKTIRIIDYKTGRDKRGTMTSLDDVFSHSKIDSHSDYFVQTMLYSMIVSKSERINPKGYATAPALFFVQNIKNKDFSPFLKIGKEEVRDIREYYDSIEGHIRKVIEEIYNPEIPFEPDGSDTSCAVCDFKTLCGR